VISNHPSALLSYIFFQVPQDVARKVTNRKVLLGDSINKQIESTLYDVKFWPWPEDGAEESIFAFTGGRLVRINRDFCCNKR
jgi:hypothetical protein